MSGNEEKVEITAGDVAKSISAMAAEIGKMVSAINSLPEKLKPVVQASKEIAQGVEAIGGDKSTSGGTAGRTFIQRQRNFFLRRRRPDVFQQGVEDKWSAREWAFQRASADEQHILASQRRADQAAKDAQVAKAARQVRAAERKNAASFRARVAMVEQGLVGGWLGEDEMGLPMEEMKQRRFAHRLDSKRSSERRSLNALREQGIVEGWLGEDDFDLSKSELRKRRFAHRVESKREAGEDAMERARYAARRAGLDDGEMNVPLRDLKRRTQEARDAQADRNKQLRNDAKDQRDANAARLLDLQKQRAVKRGFITDEQAKGITSKIGLDEAVEKGSVYSPAWLRGLGKMFGAGGISQRMSIGELAGLNNAAMGAGALAGAKGLWSLGYGNVGGGASGIGAAAGGLLGGGLGRLLGFAGGPIGMATGYLGGKVLGQGLEGALSHAGTGNDFRRLWHRYAQLGGAYGTPSVGWNWKLGLTPSQQMQHQIAGALGSGAWANTLPGEVIGFSRGALENAGANPNIANMIGYMARRGGSYSGSFRRNPPYRILDNLESAVSGFDTLSPSESMPRMEAAAQWMYDWNRMSGTSMDINNPLSTSRVGGLGRYFGNFKAPEASLSIVDRLRKNRLGSPQEIFEYLMFAEGADKATPEGLQRNLANFQKGIYNPKGMQELVRTFSKNQSNPAAAAIQLGQYLEQMGLPFDQDNATRAIVNQRIEDWKGPRSWGPSRPNWQAPTMGERSPETVLDEGIAAGKAKPISGRAMQVETIAAAQSDIAFQSTQIGISVGEAASSLEKAKTTMDEAFANLSGTLRALSKVATAVSGATEGMTSFGH